MDDPVFRTTVRPNPWPFRIRYDQPVVALGSCFADAMGERLRSDKFRVTVNPLGIIYNPLSIHRLIIHAVKGTCPDAQTLVEREGRWFCFDVHSSVHADDRDRRREQLKFLLEGLREAIREADFLMMTYGTSWIYRRKETGEVVANCHKIPAHAFTRELLDAEEVVRSYRELESCISEVNPRIRTILTVSPVRHLADSAAGNQVSKAVLLMACHRLSGETDRRVYFPSYEMMMDDLRDYRFYAADMIHPSETALDYIWSAFQSVAFSQETRGLQATWSRLRKSLDHRPFHPSSEEYREFLLRLKAELAALSDRLDVTWEMQELDNRLSSVS